MEGIQTSVSAISTHKLTRRNRMNSFQRKFRAAVLMGAAASVLAFASSAVAQDKDGDHDSKSDTNAWPYAKIGRSPVLAVVGDIACQPGTEGPGEATAEVCADAPAPYTS